jgi:hypothetical protein
MRFKKTRIVFSVFFGIVCLMLVVLWVRSYWWWDFAQYGGLSETRGVTSQNGFLLVSEIYTKDKGRWRFGSFAAEYPAELSPHLSVNWYDERPKDIAATFPHWLLILLLAFVGVAPWTFRRFSIRKLLLLTTGIAALLGFLVYFSTH